MFRAPDGLLKGASIFFLLVKLCGHTATKEKKVDGRGENFHARQPGEGEKSTVHGDS